MTILALGAIRSDKIHNHSAQTALKNRIANFIAIYVPKPDQSLLDGQVKEGPSFFRECS
jgi:hypothetical protein